MATEEGQDGQCEDKVVLKRKLTGPPRLLLGKSKSKNQGNDRSEAWAKRNQRVTVNNEAQISSSPKHSNMEAEEKVSPTDTLDSLQASNKNEEEAKAVFFEPSMHCSALEIASSDQLVQNCKIKTSAKRRWKRIFSPVVICLRRQKSIDKISVMESNHGVTIPLHSVQTKKLTEAHDKSLEEDFISLSVTDNQDDIDNITTRKGRFTIHTWPTFKKFWTSRPKPRRCGLHKKSVDIPVTFRKKIQNFLTRGRMSSPLTVPQVLEDIQDDGDREAECEPMSTQAEGEHECTCTDLPDDVPQDGREDQGQSTETVTVSAEVSVLLSNERNAEVVETKPLVPMSLVASYKRDNISNKEDPEYPQIELMKEANTVESKMFMKMREDLNCVTNTASVLDEGINVSMEANQVYIDELHQIQCLEKEEVIDDVISKTVTSFTTDTDSIPTILLEDADEAEEESQKIHSICQTTIENILHNGQILTNIELDKLCVLQCGLYEVNSSPMAEVDDSDQFGHIRRDEGFESGFYLEDHQDLVCRQSLVVQTASSLVQAAMNAAMEQLLMERQGNTGNVHREAQECRDHA